MVFLLSSFLSAFIILYIIGHFDKDFRSEGFPVYLAVTIILGLCIWMIVQISTMDSFFKPTEENIHNEIIATKTVQNENIYFSKTQIDEDFYYIVMVKKEDGSYVQKNVPVKYTAIVETDDNPHINQTIKYKERNISNYIRFTIYRKPYVGEFDTIFVPRGTMSSNIKFELI
jgi:hypothetical protein